MEEIMEQIQSCLKETECARLEIAINEEGANFYVEADKAANAKGISLSMGEETLAITIDYILEDILDLFDEYKEKIICYLIKTETGIRVRVA